MGLIRKLGKEVAIYGFGKAIGMVLGMLFVPIYARVLGSAGYGYIDLLNTAVNLTLLCAGLGLDSSVGFYYFDAKSEEQKRRVLFNGLAIRTAATLLCAAAGYVVIPLFSSFGDLNPQLFQQLLVLGLLRLPFTAIQAYCRDAMRLENKIWHFFWTTLFYSLCSVGFPILYVLVWKRGVVGVFEAALAAELCTAVVCLGIMVWRLLPRFDGVIARNLLQYGLPIFPTSILMFFVQSSDRAFIVEYCGMRELGLFTVAYKFVNILMFGIASYQLAWNVFGLQIKDDPAAHDTYARVLSLYGLGFGMISVALSLFGFEALALLTTPEFYAGAGLIGLLCCAQMIAGLFNQAVIGSAIARRTVNIPIAMAGGAALNIGANALLIPRFGLYGAAVASLLGYTLSVLIVYRLSQRCHFIPYRLMPLLVGSSVALAAAVAVPFLPQTISPALIAVKVAVLGVVAGAFHRVALSYGLIPGPAAPASVPVNHIS